MTSYAVSRGGAALVAVAAGLLLLPASAAAMQAQGIVTGVVTDEDTQRPLVGVQVYVPDSQLGTVTNQDGRYLLNLPLGEHVLRAEQIGYASIEQSVTVTADQATAVDFALATVALDLEEIVVSVDAVAARRMEFGTDIERFDAAAEVERAAVASMSDLLTGRAAGVDVQMASGPVGTASRIRVRGVTSLTQGANPIIIIDGIRTNNQTDLGPESIDWTEGRTVSRLDDLNPNDIASVQVIKGPTATALYGAGAASGVILIETRRGAAAQHRVTINSEFGFVEDVSHYWDKWYNFTKHMGITNASDPVAQQWNAITNEVTGDVWGYNNSMTNPLTSPLQRGPFSNTTLSVSGGSQDVQYFVSGRWNDSQGPYPVNNLQQGSMRANVTARTSEAFEVSLNTNYIESDIQFPESSRSFRGYSTNSGAGAPINSFGVRADGSRGDCLGTLANGASPSTCELRQGNLISNFDNLNTVFGGQKTGRFVGSATLRWSPLSWLTNRAVVGVDHSQMKDINEFPLDENRPFGVLSAGYLRDQRTTDINRTFEYTGTVTADVTPDLASTTTVGGQYFGQRAELVACIGEGGFASPTATACDAALIRTGFSNLVERVEVGAYAQQRFGYRGYLFATGGIRFDDNSAFGVEQGGIWSPSLNASAVLSDMPFWNYETINSLRLRFAWGTAAQAPPPSAAIQRLLPVSLEVGGSQVAGVSAAYPGNPELSAERKSEMEVGVDMGLLEDRLALKLTYFQQRTTDAIVTRFLSPSLGFRGEQWVNVGELENKGIELSIGAQLINTPDFSWDLDFRVSTQDPIVTDLGDTPPLFLGSNRGAFIEGFPPGAYYGPVVQSAQRDASGQIVEGSVVIADGDMSGENSYLGSPQAGDFENLSTTLSFFGGRLRLSSLFDRKGDVQKHNSSDNFHVTFGRDHAATWHYAFREYRMTPAQQVGMEKAVAGEGGKWKTFVFVEDGSFIRWRELTLSYDIPSSYLEFISASSATLSVGGRNLLTWTNYTGLDPETITPGGRTAYPANEEFYGEGQVRRFLARVQLVF